MSPVRLRVNGVWVDAGIATGSTPSAPLNVAATSTLSAQIDVTWSAPATNGSAPITNYTITAKRISTGTLKTLSVAASARSGSLTSLVIGDDYTVTVQATSSVGPSPQSNAVTVTVAGSVGGGSGAGINSAGTNVGEFGVGTFAGYRGPTNTGPFAVFDTGLNRLVTSADLSAYSRNNPTGDLDFSTPNEVVFRKIVRADRINIHATVTFIQCVIKSNDGSRSKTGSYFITNDHGVSSFYTDCLIDGNGVSGPNAAPYPSGYGFESIFLNRGSFTVLRCEVKGGQDIFKSGFSSSVRYSWVHANADFYAPAHTHSDHVQIASSSASDYTIEYNTMGTPKSVAASAGTDWSQYEPFINGGIVQIGSGFASTNTVTGLVVRFNYCNDGGYGLHGENSKAGHVDGLFSGNRVGPHMQWGAKYGQFGNAALDGSRFTLDGTNVYDDDFTAYWDNAPRRKDQVFA